MVATTLNRPFAIRSISSSICCSVEEGELRIAYVEGGIAKVGGEAVSDVAAGCEGDGRSEKSDEEGAINDKYWSMT